MDHEVLKMSPGMELDLLTDEIVFGRKSDYPTRDWSSDLRAASSLYMPIAKARGWLFGYAQFGKFHGWCVRDKEDNLIAMHRGNDIVAMLRAVLWYHLIGKHLDGSETKNERVICGTTYAVSHNNCHGKASSLACTTAA